MKRFKRILLLLSVLAIVAALMSACTQTAEPEQTLPKETSASEQTSETSDRTTVTEPPTSESPVDSSGATEPTNTETTPEGTELSKAVADAVRKAWNVEGDLTDDLLKKTEVLEIAFGTWDHAETGADGSLRLPISDLTGLEACTALRELYLLDYYGTDLGAISGLNRLEVLSVQFAGNLPAETMWDTAALVGLPLKRLEIDNYPLADLTDIGRLTSLRELWLTRCPLADLSPLANLTELEMLNLGGISGSGLQNAIRDLSPLAGLTRLQWLSLAGVEGELSPIAALPLTQLTIAWSTVSDYAPLASMQTVSDLALGNTNLTDGDTAVFGKMAGLKYVLWIAAPEGAHPEQLGDLLKAVGRSDVLSIDDAAQIDPDAYDAFMSRIYPTFRTK